MNYYIVSFDRKPTAQYGDFHKEFVAHQRIRRWSHFIKSSYVVGTEMDAAALSRHFRTIAKKHQLPTRHLVILADINERAGWMPSGAWDWFRKQVEDR